MLAAFLASPTPPEVEICASGCLGQCNMGPSVYVEPEGVWYCRVKPENVSAIVEQHLKQGKPVAELLHPRFHPNHQV